MNRLDRRDRVRLDDPGIPSRKAAVLNPPDGAHSDICSQLSITSVLAACNCLTCRRVSLLHNLVVRASSWNPSVHKSQTVYHIVSQFNLVHFYITLITFHYCSPLHLFQPTLCTFARTFCACCMSLSV